MIFRSLLENNGRPLFKSVANSLLSRRLSHPREKIHFGRSSHVTGKRIGTLPGSFSKSHKILACVGLFLRKQFGEPFASNSAGRYKPMPSKLIDPIAIALVSQACQSFELLERLHEGSVVLSPDVLISADLTALFHHRPARFFPFFHYPLQLDSQPRI